MLAFVVALPCEAKPLIHYFGLKRYVETPFPLYKNETLFLVISGVGKVAAATAVGFLARENITAWLNVGVAGHASEPVGEAFLAHKIIGDTKNFYPTLFPSFKVASRTVHTVDRPQIHFLEDALFEMEAAGFMEAALRFSTTELCHAYKIVSDNCLENNISPDKVSQLIDNQLFNIENIATQLRTMAQKPLLPSLEPWKNHWHFTATELHNLSRLLERYASFSQTPSPLAFASLTKAELFAALEQQIHSYVPCYLH